MKNEAEDKRTTMLYNYQMQAGWLSWGLEHMMKQDKSWQVLLYQYSQRLLQFVLNSQLNTLPSPDNLRRWNANKDAFCGLCTQKHAPLCHILAGCPWVRGAENKLAHREDRYTWRHTMSSWPLPGLWKSGLQRLMLKLSRRKLSNLHLCSQHLCGPVKFLNRRKLQ